METSKILDVLLTTQFETNLRENRIFHASKQIFSGFCTVNEFLFCSWYLNPAALTVVDTDDVEIEEGDFVVISNMEDKVKAKQQGHGGWNPAMEKVIRKHKKDFHIVDSLL